MSEVSKEWLERNFAAVQAFMKETRERLDALETRQKKMEAKILQCQQLYSNLQGDINQLRVSMFNGGPTSGN